MFDEVIEDCKGYIERDGFVFTCVTHPANVYDAIFIKNIKNDVMPFRNFPEVDATLDEHIDFINQHHLEKAMIFADNLDFLKYTPSIKYLDIVIYYENMMVDYTPLYQMPQIKSLVVINYNFEKLPVPIDYSKIKGLEYLNIAEKGHKNYETLENLKTLSIGPWKQKDIQNLFVSRKLDTLRLIQTGIHSLAGIEKSDNLQCLYLYYNRSLQDISALSSVKKTLKILRIENCPQIEDFSVLAELENLELLELVGKNTVPDLQFIKHMKALKTFVFDINVLDGDLSPCLKMSYAYSGKNRKHYNLKDRELPKEKCARGNESIEVWRRME